MNVVEFEINQRSEVVRLDHELCRSALQLICTERGTRRAQFSIVVVDDQESRALHRRYLQQDSATDVLSFVLDEQAESVEGEIVVNAELARRVAAGFGWSPADELLLYVIHGALHLAGYDDQQDTDRERMFARQREILASIGFDPVRVSVAVRTASRSTD